VFVANCCKSPQIAKIATYAGFADPDFRLQQRAQKKNPNVRNIRELLGIENSKSIARRSVDRYI